MADDNTNRRSGTISLDIDGETIELNGEFTYNLGGKKRTAKVGPKKVYGYKEEQMIPKIEGEILDSSQLDVKAKLLDISNSTITLELANGKIFILRNAWWGADGDIGTAEANIQAVFEGIEGEEILP